MIMPDEQRCVLNDSLALSRLELSTGHADLFRIFALMLHVSYTHGNSYVSLSHSHQVVSVGRTRWHGVGAIVWVYGGMRCRCIGTLFEGNRTITQW